MKNFSLMSLNIGRLVLLVAVFFSATQSFCGGKYVTRMTSDGKAKQVWEDDNGRLSFEERSQARKRAQEDARAEGANLLRLRKVRKILDDSKSKEGLIGTLETKIKAIERAENQDRARRAGTVAAPAAVAPVPAAAVAPVPAADDVAADDVAADDVAVPDAELKGFLSDLLVWATELPVDSTVSGKDQFKEHCYGDQILKKGVTGDAEVWDGKAKNDGDKIRLGYKTLHLNQLDKEIQKLHAKWKRFASYDHPFSAVFREFLPEHGGSAGFGESVLLMGAIPMATNFRTALDDELKKGSTWVIRWIGRQIKPLLISAGFLSPLTTRHVDSWLRYVKGYREAMRDLAKAQGSDEYLATSFEARDGERPGRQIVPGQEGVAQENVVQVSEVAELLRQSKPIHLRNTDVFVRQLMSQISGVLQDMSNAASYESQRGILNDTLHELKGIEVLVVGTYELHHQPILTSNVNHRLQAVCSSLESLFNNLRDMINVDAESVSSSDDDRGGFGGVGKGLGRGR